MEGFEQVGLNHGSDKRVVIAGALSRSGHVVGCVRGHQHLVNDVNHTVAREHVGLRDVGVVDHHAVGDGESEWLTVDCCCGHAVGDVGGWNSSGHHVIEQNIGERLLAFGCVKGCEIDARIGEGLVGRCEHREGSGALKRGEQFGLNHGGNQRVVHARALGRSRYVVGGLCGHQHLVDDVDETVARDDVGHRDVCVVDHGTVPDREGKRVSVGSGCRHAVGNVGCGNASTHHVVQQNIAERCLALRCIKSDEVNTGINEGLVGGCEHRERARLLEGSEEVSLDDGSDQGIVNSRRLRRGGNVNRWNQHRVDDVDNAVGGLDVRCCHRSSANGNGAASNAEFDVVAVDGGGDHAVREVAGGDLSADDVVKQNLGEGGVLLWRVEVVQVNACVDERLIGGCKHRERPGSLERGHQVGVG